MSTRDDLLALQDVDSALDQLQNRIDRLPERAAAKAASDALDDLHRARHAAEGERAAAEAELERIETESADIDRHRTRLEAQMKTIIAPREAEALQHEIATLVARRDELDDVGLQTLDIMAAADGRVADALAAEPGAQERKDAADEALAAVASDLARQMTDLQPARVAAAAALDARTLERYEAMRRQHGGVAVARLAKNQCTGCHLDLSVGEADEIRRVPDDQVPECPSCGRLLVP